MKYLATALMTVSLLSGCTGNFGAVLQSDKKINLNNALSSNISQLVALKASSYSGFELDAPKNRQVFQRDQNNSAAVSVSGKLPSSASRMRITVSSDAGILKDLSLDVSGKNQGEEFSQSILMPAGGWYKLSLTLLNGVDEVASSDEVLFGIGEVFIAAGQSNSANYGEVQTIGSDMTSTYDPSLKRWVVATDPMPGADGNGGSPWPVFASTLSRTIHLPVAVLSIGCGGTYIADWLPQMAANTSAPGSIPSDAALRCTSGPPYSQLNLYNRMLSMLKMLAPNGARGILWHQGESDTVAQTSRNDYQWRLNYLLNQFDQDSGRTWNYFVARASYFPGDDVDPANCAIAGKNQYGPAMEQISSAQASINYSGRAYAGPDLDHLTGSRYRYTTPGGACVHLNHNGLSIHSRGWLNAVARSGLIPELKAELAPLRRFYNFTTHKHFMTSDDITAHSATSNGWVEEKILGFVMLRPVGWDDSDKMQPWFWLWKLETGDSGFSYLQRDIQAAQNQGYVLQPGTLGYLFPYDLSSSGTVPLFMAYTSVTSEHFYTTDESEYKTAVASGFVGYGIAGWVLP